MLWLNHFLQPNQLIHWTENWERKYNDRVWVKYFLLHFKYIFAWLMWSASAVFSFKWENTHLSPRLMSWKEIDGTAYRMEFRNPKVGWQQFWDPFFSLQQSCSILRIYPTSYQIVWWMTFTFGGRVLEPKMLWQSLCWWSQDGKWIPLQGSGQWATKYFPRWKNMTKTIWHENNIWQSKS